MRFFRLISITVLLLACVVLGSACAGAKGDIGPKGDPGADGVGIQSIANNADGTLTIYLTNGQSYTTGDLTGPQGDKGDAGAAGDAGAKGDTGAQGVQGIQGPPGPNMIVAMGFVNMYGSLVHGYNATSATWDSTHYDVALTAISAGKHYVTLITPYWNTTPGFAYTLSTSGDLQVVMWESGWVQCGFSFMVLECPS